MFNSNYFRASVAQLAIITRVRPSATETAGGFTDPHFLHESLRHHPLKAWTIELLSPLLIPSKNHGVIQPPTRFIAKPKKSPTLTASGLDEIDGITRDVWPVCRIKLHFSFLHPRQDFLVLLTWRRKGWCWMFFFFALEIPHLLKLGTTNSEVANHIKYISNNGKYKSCHFHPWCFYIVPTEINWHKLANYGASLHRNKWP